MPVHGSPSIGSLGMLLDAIARAVMRDPELEHQLTETLREAGVAVTMTGGSGSPDGADPGNDVADGEPEGARVTVSPGKSRVWDCTHPARDQIKGGNQWSRWSTCRHCNTRTSYASTKDKLQDWSVVEGSQPGHGAAGGDTILRRGRHQGKSFGEVCAIDPDFAKWAMHAAASVPLESDGWQELQDFAKFCKDGQIRQQ
jgi:hypothetical protein